MNDADDFVLYRSEDIAVVNKPAGLPTEPTPRGETSLRDRVASALVGAARVPHAVSRLDTNVTGAVLFALTARGARALADAKQEGRYARVYVALCAGRPGAAGAWTEPIAGQPAETAFWSVAEVGAEKRPTVLLAVMPRTGRTHQIRIHASTAGAPLAGDKRYGGPSTGPTPRGATGTPPRPRPHPTRGTFPAPSRGGIVVRAPVAPDMQALWSALDGRPEAWEEALAVCGVASSSPAP